MTRQEVENHRYLLGCYISALAHGRYATTEEVLNAMLDDLQYLQQEEAIIEANEIVNHGSATA